MNTIGKKWLAALAATVLLAAMCPLGVFAAYANTHQKTDDQSWDIVQIARTQIGYLEGSLDGGKFISDNYTKYGVWYNDNISHGGGFSRASWCAMFVSWCANQAGIPESEFLRHASCTLGMRWWKERGLFYPSASRGGTYVPKRGDIVYFLNEDDYGASHIGIVTHADNDRVYTIEGNADTMDVMLDDDGGVFERYYAPSDSYILGYATPRYTTGTATTAEKLGVYKTLAPIAMRSGASANASVVATLAKAELFTVTTRSGDWGYAVRADGTRGWCNISHSVGYIGQDLLAGNLTASRDHVRMVTDSKGRVTVTNTGAAPVTVDLPVVTPIGTATTPYLNVRISHRRGGYHYGLLSAGGKTMWYDHATATWKANDNVATITELHAVQHTVKEIWTPSDKARINRMRIVLDANSEIFISFAYMADQPGVIQTTAYNTRVYDRSDLATVPAVNVTLMHPDTLQAEDITRAGEWSYKNGLLTVTSRCEDGYAVTMEPSLDYSAEALHRLLCKVASDAAFDVTLSVMSESGEGTVSLAAMQGGDRIEAGDYDFALSLYDCLNENGLVGADGRATIDKVTVRLESEGTLVLGGLQINDNDTAVTFEDDIVKSEQTPPYVPDENEGLYEFVVEDGAATVIAYLGDETDVTVPSMLGGAPVKAIGDGAFCECVDVQSVTLPEGVESIGEEAFSGCSSLERITLPASVTSVGWSAFDYCDALETVFFGGSEEQWQAMTVLDGNRPLLDAQVVFPPEPILGDISGDGKLNTTDAFTLYAAVSRGTALDLTTADMNGDGRLNITDAFLLYRITSGQ